MDIVFGMVNVVTHLKNRHNISTVYMMVPQNQWRVKKDKNSWKKCALLW